MSQLKELQKYRRLGREGAVQPLTHHCGMEYTIKTNSKGEDPWLECLSCSSNIFPGLKMWEQIYQANRKFYDN